MLREQAACYCIAQSAVCALLSSVTSVQAFGVNQADVEAYLPSAVNSFIVQGNLTALTANQGLPPLLALQVPQSWHC